VKATIRSPTLELIAKWTEQTPDGVEIQSLTSQGFPTSLSADVITKLMKVYSRWPRDKWLEILPATSQTDVDMDTGQMSHIVPSQLFELPTLNLRQYQEFEPNQVHVHDVIAVRGNRTIWLAWVQNILPLDILEGFYFEKLRQSNSKYTLDTHLQQIPLATVVAVGVEMRPYWDSTGKLYFTLCNQLDTLREMSTKEKDALSIVEDKGRQQIVLPKNNSRLRALLTDKQIALDIWACVEKDL